MTAKARPAARHTSFPSPLAGEGGAKARGEGDISTHKATVEIFCDGACRGNPGPGGWGAVLRSKGHYKELSGFKERTTNNEMELTAAIESLSALKNPSRVTVTTDSDHVMKGMREWIHGWKKNGWKTSAKKPVKNQELWQALSAAAARHEVDWKWVRGHAGHPENERADALANEAMDRGLAGK